MTGLVLFLMFTVIPAVELWLLIEIGRVFGGWETVAWVVLMGMVGAWLGKRAGFAVLRDLFRTVQEGGSPANQLVEAGLVLVGAVLLITPGVLTDLTGAVLFIGPVRRFLAPRVKSAVLSWARRRGLQVGTLGPGPAHPQRAAREARERGHFDHPVA